MQLNPNDKILYNAFWSQDNFTEVDGFWEEEKEIHDQYRDEFRWGNFATSIKWNRSFGNKIFTNLTGYFSSYGYQSINGFQSYAGSYLQYFAIREKMEFRSGIQETGLKAVVSFLPWVNHETEVGIGSKWFAYTPGIIAYLDPGFFAKCGRFLEAKI